MVEYNSDIVIPTLKEVVKILETHKINYRLLGSIVLAGINGKLHRPLEDLDLLVDMRKKDILLEELKKVGYMRGDGIITFARNYLSLEQLQHAHLLSVGYFFGTWQTDGSFVMGGKRAKMIIEAFALEKTRYIVHDTAFIGIPPRAAATGVYASKTNPKRIYERKLLKEKGIQPFPNTHIHTSIHGRKADWMYHFSMGTLNLLGKARVRMGLAFDPWR